MRGAKQKPKRGYSGKYLGQIFWAKQPANSGFFASASCPNRLAFFHKGTAAFNIISTVKTGLNHCFASGQITLAFILACLIGNEFYRINGQRRIAGDGCCHFIGCRLDCAIFNNPVHQPHDPRFFSVKPARGEKDFLGKGRANKIGKPVNAKEPITKPKPRCRNGKI